MICELIPKEFLIVPYDDWYFFNGASSKTIKTTSNYSSESFTYDTGTFDKLWKQRHILVDYYNNKKLAKLIPENIVDFYISKIHDENVSSFYRKYRDIIQRHARPYNDKLYILPDIYISLSTTKCEGIPFKDKFMSSYYVDGVVSKMKDARYNKIITAICNDSSSVLDMYIVDAEYILNNIPDCVCCKQHNFKIDVISSHNLIRCHSCGFEIPDLRKFLCCVHAGKRIMKINEK